MSRRRLDLGWIDRDQALRHASPEQVRHKMLMSPRMMPGQGGAGGGTPNIFFHDFNDFTTGVYPTNVAVGVNITVPADHTGGGRGGILRIRYVDLDPSDAPADINRYLDPTPPTSAGYGSTIYFSGELYFDNPTVNFTNGGVQRKLVYMRNDNGAFFNPQHILRMFGNQLSVEFFYDGDIASSQSTHFAGAILSVGTWHKIGYKIQVESAPGVKDGHLRYWLDNVMVQQYPNWSMTHASETKPFRWNRWWVGAQREGLDGESVDETRYWNDVGWGSLPMTGYHGI